jgi:hypothetical protein
MAVIKDIELINEGKWYQIQAFKVNINDNILYGFYRELANDNIGLEFGTSVSGLLRDKAYLGKDFSKLPGELKVKLQPQTQRQLEEAIQEFLDFVEKSREATLTI